MQLHQPWTPDNVRFTNISMQVFKITRRPPWNVYKYNRPIMP